MVSQDELERPSSRTAEAAGALVIFLLAGRLMSLTPIGMDTWAVWTVLLLIACAGLACALLALRQRARALRQRARADERAAWEAASSVCTVLAYLGCILLPLSMITSAGVVSLVAAGEGAATLAVFLAVRLGLKARRWRRHS
jgi:hypothetical protein